MFTLGFRYSMVQVLSSPVNIAHCQYPHSFSPSCFLINAEVMRGNENEAFLSSFRLWNSFVLGCPHRELQVPKTGKSDLRFERHKERASISDSFVVLINFWLIRIQNTGSRKGVKGQQWRNRGWWTQVTVSTISEHHGPQTWTAPITSVIYLPRSNVKGKTEATGL